MAAEGACDNFFSSYDEVGGDMNDMPLRERWLQMMATKDFAHLSNYDDAKVVDPLCESDRELLALLMIHQGQAILKSDYSAGAYYLERATEVAPHSLTIALHKGEAYARLVDVESAQEAAAAAYAVAAAMQPQEGLTWCQWGTVLMRLGTMQSNFAMLLHGDRLFARAEALGPPSNSTYSVNLFWAWAQLWYACARLSGEPCDLHKALQKYRKAAQLDPKAASFWSDYANALWEMGGFLRQTEVFAAVEKLYLRAIRLNPRNFSAQYNLGVCYQRFFEATWKSSFFWSAHEHFTHCRVIDPENGSLYAAWGRLLLLQGQLRHDCDCLSQACDQLERAQLLIPADHGLKLDLSHAYLCCGALCEDISLIHQAEELAIELLTQDPSHVKAWVLLGRSLAERGYYYDEKQLYLEALEKFHHALSLDRTSIAAWHGAASANLDLGELLNDVERLQAAILQFEQATEFDGPFTPQFWSDWGLALMKLADINQDAAPLEAALLKFQTAIEMDLSHSNGEYADAERLFHYGCAYDFLGDLTEEDSYYEKSIAIFQKVLEIDPQYIQAHYGLAVAYSHFGETAADIDALHHACQHFYHLLSQDDEDEMAWNEWGLALINLALLLYDDIEPHVSERYFQDAETKILRAASLGYNVAYYNLACLASLRGDYMAAISFLERSEHASALPPIEDIMQDAWLDGLRQTEQFHRLLSYLLGKQGRPS